MDIIGLLYEWLGSRVARYCITGTSTGWGSTDRVEEITALSRTQIYYLCYNDNEGRWPHLLSTAPLSTLSHCSIWWWTVILLRFVYPVCFSTTTRIHFTRILLVVVWYRNIPTKFWGQNAHWKYLSPSKWNGVQADGEWLYLGHEWSRPGFERVNILTFQSQRV